MIIEHVRRDDINCFRTRTMADVGINTVVEHVEGLSRPSTGVAFVRRAGSSEKDKARQIVAKWFSPDLFPWRLRILTMPSINWTFEKMLLARRSGVYRYPSMKRRVKFICAEVDEPIYRAALYNIPTPDGNSLRSLATGEKWTSATFRTGIVDFYRCDAIDLLMNRGWSHRVCNAAWLDFCGPLTLPRWTALADMWARNKEGGDHNAREFHIRRIAVTVMRGRYGADVAEAVKVAGGYQEWILSAFPGAVIRDITAYSDSVAMLQIIIDAPWSDLKAATIGGL